jgi:DNA repair protein RecO (recombination protein O)
VSEIRDEAIVLRTYKLGEADRICVLLTRSHGKVRAVAKGVRKTSSRLGARMEALDHVDVLLHQGRSELLAVRQVEPRGTVRTVRDDYERLSSAMVMVETADLVTEEFHADPGYFEMLLRALVALEGAADPRTVATAYLLKTLAHDGAAPILDRCASCGEDTELVAFDLVEGGLLCRDCRRGRPVSQAAVSLLRRIMLGGLSGVLAEEHPEGADEVSAITLEAMEAHLGRRLKTARALDVR